MSIILKLLRLSQSRADLKLTSIIYIMYSIVAILDTILLYQIIQYNEILFINLNLIKLINVFLKQKLFFS